MVNPVVIESGNTYEKEAIRKVFQKAAAIDPITGQSLGSTKLVKNLAITSLIRKQWGFETNAHYTRIGVITGFHCMCLYIRARSRNTPLLQTSRRKLQCNTYSSFKSLGPDEDEEYVLHCTMKTWIQLQQGCSLL